MVGLQPLLAIVAGVLVLVYPRHMRYFVGVYLILAGLFGLGVVRG